MTNSRKPTVSRVWVAASGATLATGVALAGCATIDAPAPGDAARGRQIVEKWCGTCHAVAANREAKPSRASRAARAPSAPPFAEVARRSGRDDAYFRNFLAGDHFPMPTYRLFEHERDDVVAFLRSLRNG